MKNKTNMKRSPNWNNFGGNVILFLIILTLMSACKKDQVEPDVPPIDPPIDSTKKTVTIGLNGIPCFYQDEKYYVQAYQEMLRAVEQYSTKYDSLIITFNGRVVAPDSCNVEDALFNARNNGEFWAIVKTNNKMKSGQPVNPDIPSNVRIESVDFPLKTIWSITNPGKSWKWMIQIMDEEGTIWPFTPPEGDEEWQEDLLATLSAEYKLVMVCKSGETGEKKKQLPKGKGQITFAESNHQNGYNKYLSRHHDNRARVAMKNQKFIK